MTIQDNANSIEFVLRPGVVDLGAYEFQSSSLDVTPPVILSTTPVGVMTGSNTVPRVPEIELNFSELLNPISARSLTLVKNPEQNKKQRGQARPASQWRYA